MSFPPWESLGLSNLFLRNENISKIPELSLPAGYSLIGTPLQDSEHEELAGVLRAAFGIQHGVWDTPRITKEFLADPTVKRTWRLLYTSAEGQVSIVGTASIRVIPDKYPGSGYMHWVAVHPSHQGKGLAMHVSCAVLREARDVYHFQSCVLETQDTSLPAITTYEKLGFSPVNTDDSHQARWVTIRENLKKKGEAKTETIDPKVQQILDMKAKYPDNLAIQCFDLAYYNSLSKDMQARFLKCLDSGRENSDSGMGCYANHPDDYEVFFPFFKQALSRYHKVNLDEKKHVNNWSLEGVQGLPADGKLDLSKLGLPALSMRVRTGRNLKKFPLPGSMTKQDRLDMENAMGQVFEKLIADSAFGGRYVSITPGHKNFVDEKEYQQLVDDHIMFKDMSSDPYLNSAGISRDWPFGRGCYISADKGFIIWVGEEDHLRIMAMQKGTILNAVFDRLKAAIDVVEKLIEGGCAYSPTFGVVTSCPTNIGTGMRASVHIALPNLTADGTDTKAKAIARPLGLSVRGLGGEHTPIGKDGTVDISPSARFCISEAEIVTALYLGLSKLKAAEEAAKQ